jgi:hypothetical protein
VKTIKLSPSDFAFLYENCKRCFYLKAINDMYPPSTPMPRIFNAIDNQEKIAFQGALLSELAEGLPEGKIVSSDNWVTSTYVKYPELNYQQHIKGRLDSLMKMDDGSYQIIDFKTSNVSDHNKLYRRQLHAYAYGLENPMNGHEKLDGPISGLGLIIFDPCLGFSLDNNNGVLKGTITWEPLPYTPDKFVTFMQQIANLLSKDEEPDFNPNCSYCQRDLVMIEQGRKIDGDKFLNIFKEFKQHFKEKINETK